MSALPRSEDIGANEHQRSSRFLGVPIWGAGCALLLLLAILVARPYAEVGISDDFSYIWSAKVLAQTGHVAYNGGATAILGWQLYLAALIDKLFGFSFTATRASVIMISVATAFLCQRTFVRAGANEWNASIGTLTLMLSPLLMLLEVTFMTDVPCLFAMIVCLYACFRAIQADKEWVSIGWIGFASLSNVVLGSSRQIGWLGVLVMVPSALWLLRRKRATVVAGAGFWLASVVLLLTINHWFQQQPYILYEPLRRGVVTPHVLRHMTVELIRACFEVVLLLLPILLMYLPALRKRKYPWVVYLTACGFLFYGLRLWEIHNLKAWFAPYLGGVLPFAHLTRLRPILTIAVIFCSLALIMALAARSQKAELTRGYGLAVSDRTILVLLVPFTIAYVGLLLPRAGFENIWDRYLLPPLFIAIIFILRFYQKHFQPRLPITALVLALCFGAYATASLHDRLALYRVRVDAVNEVLASGIPDTSVSGGWDYDGWTELEHSGHIVDPRMRVPMGMVQPKPTHYGLENCRWFYCNMFPHVVPYYTISFRPDAAGNNKFAPVPYRTWVDSPGTIYVVRFPDRSVGGRVP
jgi:hypothetical protein